MHYRWSIAKAGWSQTFLCADSALNPGVEILAIWDQRQQRVMLRSCSSPAERLTHWQRASVSIPAPWWEANYRREREKTLAALISPPCSFFQDLYVVFQANPLQRSAPRPAREQLYFIWIKKYLGFQRALSFTVLSFPLPPSCGFPRCANLFNGLFILWSSVRCISVAQKSLQCVFHGHQLVFMITV